MKLYTEIEMLEAIYRAIFSKPNINSFDILEEITPIELPSDELIVLNRWESFKEVYGLEYEEVSYVDGFTRGAKWMREKIQGGNK